MSDLRVQKRMAADLLDCGRNRVWIDPLEQDEVATAITRDDIRRLIDQGVIQKREEQGTSRGRARERDRQKAKGRQRGPGKRSGSKGARNPSKEAWKNRIRAIRDQLKTLRDEGYIDPSTYRTYYKRANGGRYDSRRHLLNHLAIDGVISEEEAEQLQEASD